MHYGREGGRGVDRKLDGVSETMIDWDNTGVNRRQRTGEWGMDGGRRRRGEINMALIVSSAPLPSLDQPFITPPQSVQHRHFGKWGPALTPSAKTAAATYVGACACVRVSDPEKTGCMCVSVCVEWMCSCVTYTEMIARLPADEFLSLIPMVGRGGEKKIQTHFSFSFHLPQTPSISRGKSNGKSSARAFCIMLTLIRTLVWKAGRHHVEN